MDSNSSAAIIKQSASKGRYTLGDSVLSEFYRSPGVTGMEIIALYAFKNDWVGALLAASKSADLLAKFVAKGMSIQKRITDLSKLNYLTAQCSRECRITGGTAKVYVITKSGMDHLAKVGFSVRVNRVSTAASFDPVSAADSVADQVSVKSRFADLKSSFNP